MKKIITCALVAAAAAVAQPAMAAQFGVDGAVGNAGQQTTGTTFVYDSQEPSTALVYSTKLVTGSETKVHGVLADTTFTVPANVRSAKLEHTFTGTNNTALETTLSSGADSVSQAANTVTALAGGETLHILLQNTQGRPLSAGATTITYNVTTYTN